MKRNVLSPLFFAALLVVIAGLACRLFTPATQIAPEPIILPTSAPFQPTIAPPVQPTAQPQPTDAPPMATLMPSSPFFKEEFDTDVLSSWTSFIITGSNSADKKKSSFSIKGGKLLFKLEDEQLYSYLIYDKQSYNDARLEISAYNRGKNTNNISLICRYSEDGWYEFSITSGGLFQIWAYDATGAVSKGYNLINSGGSTAIRMGNETNVYAVSCVGDQLTLYINGLESASFAERKFGFKEGKVGINVSSLGVIPIIVEIDYFDIQKP